MAKFHKIKTSCERFQTLFLKQSYLSWCSTCLDAWQLNRIIRLDESAESDEIFRGLIQAVDREGRKRIQMFSKMIQMKRSYNENVFQVEGFTDKVLEYTLTKDDRTDKKDKRINAYNKWILLTKEEHWRKCNWCVGSYRMLIDNLPQKSKTFKRLYQLCKPINQDALSKITNSIAFDATQEIFQH